MFHRYRRHLYWLIIWSFTPCRQYFGHITPVDFDILNDWPSRAYSSSKSSETVCCGKCLSARRSIEQCLGQKKIQTGTNNLYVILVIFFVVRITAAIRTTVVRITWLTTLLSCEWLLAKGVGILDTGHHLTSHPTDIKTLNKYKNVESVEVSKFCYKNHTPAKYYWH